MANLILNEQDILEAIAYYLFNHEYYEFEADPCGGIELRFGKGDDEPGERLDDRPPIEAVVRLPSPGVSKA